MGKDIDPIEERVELDGLCVPSAYSDALHYTEQLSHYGAYLKLASAMSKVIRANNKVIAMYNELNGRFNGATFTVGTGDVTTDKIADGGVTLAKVGNDVLGEMRRIAASEGGSNAFIRDSMRTKPKGMVTFIDDDCRREAFEKLYMKVLVQNTVPEKIKIPYAFAVPWDNLTPDDAVTSSDRYMSVSQFLRMCRAGAEATCHTHREYNMDEFTTAEAFAAMLDECDRVYRGWGIDVDGYCYCQGKWVPEYMNIVKAHFKCGFTVENGINTVPLESYYLKRWEVFKKNNNDGTYPPKSEMIERIESVIKPQVQAVKENGGWLVLMTHAWYGAFDTDLLNELITYIQDEGVEIVGIKEALSRVGNVVETGLFKKPIEDVVEPYFVVDANGKAWANQIDTGTAELDGTVVPLHLVTGKVLCSTMRPSNPVYNTADPLYVVSEPVDVSDCAKVRVSGFATYNDSNGSSFPYDVYCFTDATGKALPNGAYHADKVWSEGGTILSHYECPVPSGAKYIRVAGYTTNKMPPALAKLDPTPSEIYTKIGSMANLMTTNKSDLVGAINELYSLLNGGTGEGVSGVTVDVPVSGYEEGKYINANGKLATRAYVAGSTNASDRRRITYVIEVNPSFKQYIMTCSAINGGALYVFRDSSGNTISGYPVDETNSVTGTVFNQRTVEIPKSAATLILSCNDILTPNGCVLKGVMA